MKKFSFTVIEGQFTADYGRLIHDIIIIESLLVTTFMPYRGLHFFEKVDTTTYIERIMHFLVRNKQELQEEQRPECCLIVAGMSHLLCG